MLAKCLLSVLLVGLGLRAEAPPAIALGTPRPAVEASLGRPAAVTERGGFVWLRYDRPGETLELGFYRALLGAADITPKRPMAWPEAAAWARALVPGFDEGGVIREGGTWHYVQEIRVERLPFEAELSFHRRGDRVGRLEAAMHWLD